MQLLRVQNLEVEISKKRILKGIDFEISTNETVVLLGPNAAGKSTVARALRGDSDLNTKGEIRFSNKVFLSNKINKRVDERARAGLFVSEQNPVEIPGVTTTEMLKMALKSQGKLQIKKGVREKCEDVPEYVITDRVREKISVQAKKLGLNIWFSERELNVGFSGGERKKNEILQMLVLGPKLAVLDEIDSGLDMDAAEQVSKVLKEFQEETGVSYLIITHNMRVLKHLKPSRTLVLAEGCIVRQGDGKLALEVEREGFKGILEGVK